MPAWKCPALDNRLPICHGGHRRVTLRCGLLMTGLNTVLIGNEFESGTLDAGRGAAGMPAAETAPVVGSATRLSVDALLQRLGAGPVAPFYVQAGNGLAWRVDPLGGKVLGHALSSETPLDSASLLTVVPRVTQPAGQVRELPYDQWVYWLARGARGESLLESADAGTVSVLRGVASPSHGRDFARLVVAYGRPLDVAQAVQLTRLPVAVVHSFLNASRVLGRVRRYATGTAAGAARGGDATSAVERLPASAAVTAANRTHGLFSRLLGRLRGDRVRNG